MEIPVDWTKEVFEKSQGVWTVVMVHKLGPKVEMTGEDLAEIEKEVEKSVIIMDRQIKEELAKRNKA